MSLTEEEIKVLHEAFKRREVYFSSHGVWGRITNGRKTWNPAAIVATHRGAEFFYAPGATINECRRGSLAKHHGSGFRPFPKSEAIAKQAVEDVAKYCGLSVKDYAVKITKSRAKLFNGKVGK